MIVRHWAIGLAAAVACTAAPVSLAQDAGRNLPGLPADIAAVAKDFSIQVIGQGKLGPIVELHGVISYQYDEPNFAWRWGPGFALYPESVDPRRLVVQVYFDTQEEARQAEVERARNPLPNYIAGTFGSYGQQDANCPPQEVMSATNIERVKIVAEFLSADSIPTQFAQYGWSIFLLATSVELAPARAAPQ